MEVHEDSRHIVVVRRGQFCEQPVNPRKVIADVFTLDWFDCLDSNNRPLLSDKEIFSNLEAIVRDADKTPVLQVSCHPR